MAGMNKLREHMAQQFLDALNQGKLPWSVCWQQALPVNMSTGKKYRGVNAFYLSYIAEEKGYTDPRWCTYKQAQEKGWQVRKGEVSARVEYWAYYDREQKKLLSWDEARRLLDKDPAYEINLQLSSRVYSVFNASQIDGVPALVQKHTDIGAIREQRDTLIRNMNVGYQEHGSQAYYSPGTDTVTLPMEKDFDDTYSYMATFLHECGHATGHPTRLNRDLSGMFGGESYAREELRAEIASAFTAQALGLALTDEQLEAHMKQHIAYVQSWASALQKSPEELFRAIKAAEEISDYLIEKGEFEMNNELEVRYTVDPLPDRAGMLLHIQGQGVVPSFEDPSLRPYQKHADEIKEVLIDDGITGIGDRAFNSLPALEKISWPRSIEHIGNHVLENSPMLKEIEYTGDVQSRLDMSRAAAPSELLAMAEQYPGMTREQLDEISGAVRDGLMPEQIAVFAQPQFNALQMNAIRYSFCCGLTSEQIGLLANPSFDSVQMDIIRSSFQAGMGMEQVKLFARPDIPSQQMLDAYWAIREGRGWENQVTAAQQLSDEEAALRAAADEDERIFWKMNDYLDRGGDIAALADWDERDLLDCPEP